MQLNGGRWWQATGLGLILLTGAGLVVLAEQNDSGQNQCYDGHDMVACTEATSGDQAPHPRQDGRYGRDAQGERLTKTGGGLAGFDPALDAAYFPHSLSSPYRTATPGPGQSWVIHFSDGQATRAPQDQSQYLRLVRGPGAPSSSHGDSGDGTASSGPNAKAKACPAALAKPPSKFRPGNWGHGYIGFFTLDV